MKDWIGGGSAKPFPFLARTIDGWKTKPRQGSGKPEMRVDLGAFYFIYRFIYMGARGVFRLDRVMFHQPEEVQPVSPPDLSHTKVCKTRFFRCYCNGNENETLQSAVP